MALPSTSARMTRATSICPGCPRTAWMRGSNGTSEPLIASSDKAPTTSAVAKTSSAPNSPANPNAVDTWVPLSSASPSLGASTRGWIPARRSPSPRGYAFALDPDLADPDQGRRQVCERSQIPRGADRALGGNTGVDAGIDERKQRFDHLLAYTRATPSQADRLEDQHQPDDLVGKQCTGPGAVREHEVSLQLAQPVGGDDLLGELAEAGVDAVGNRAPLEDSADCPMRRLDLLQCSRLDPQKDALVAYPPQLSQCHPAGERTVSSLISWAMGWRSRSACALSPGGGEGAAVSLGLRSRRDLVLPKVVLS